jgi:very-short-patch-repair endonuclease
MIMWYNLHVVEDNTEGTAEPADSVETAREMSIGLRSMSADQLQQEYDTVGNIKKLVEIHHISYRVIRRILTDAGIKIKKPGEVSPAARGEGQRKRWQDPAARQKQSETISSARQRPEVIEAHSEAARRRREDPVAREAYSEMLRQQWENNPERRQYISDVMKDEWADPEKHAQRVSAMRNSERVQESQHDPAVIAKKMKQWDDPERREQQRQLWFENVASKKPNPGEFPLAEVKIHDALMKASVSFTTNAVMLSAYAVDVLIHQRKLVLEIDGPIHNGMREADGIRDNALQEAGYDVVRFQNKHVMKDADECIASLHLVNETDPVFDVKTLKDVMSDLITQIKRREKMDSDTVRSAVDGKPAEAGRNDQPSMDSSC